jgi:hypothetical protein
MVIVMFTIKAWKFTVKAAVLLVSVCLFAGIVFGDSNDFSLFANVSQDSMTKEAVLIIFINPSQANVSYNIDGAENVALPQSSVSYIQGHYIYSVTLPQLSEGNHTVNVYAKFAGENRFVSQTFNFTQTATPTQISQTPTGSNPTPQNPLLALIIVFVLAFIISIALLVIFNKNKKKNN